MKIEKNPEKLELLIVQLNAMQRVSLVPIRLYICRDLYNLIAVFCLSFHDLQINAQFEAQILLLYRPIKDCLPQPLT